MKLLFAATAAVALMGFASSAAAAPVTTWTGFYVGGSIGQGSSDQDWTQKTSSLALPLDYGREQGLDLSGATYGVQGGYDYAFGGPFFVGGELSLDISTQDGHENHAVFQSYGSNSELSYIVALRGRVGVANDSGAIYLTGGYAAAENKSSITFNGVRTTNEVKDTLSGWTIGGGAEARVHNNWTVRVQYDYYDFGNDRNVYTYTANPAGLVEGWDVDTRVSKISLGVNYRFGGQ